MKKLFIILALMATGMCARAQYDTLNIGDREPTFYYWDTNWWDYYYLNYPEARADSCQWSYGFSASVPLRTERARYCYTDKPLRIIGVAAAFSINVGSDTITNIFHLLPAEYLSLYEVDPATDEMVPLASKSWNWTIPRYQIVREEVNNYELCPDTVLRIPPKYAPIYEVYFDSAITVNDSFYVSATQNNYSRGVPRPVACGVVTISAQLRSSTINSETGTVYSYGGKFSPKPNHYRRKLHDMPSYEWEDRYYGFMDTAWHTVGKTRYDNPYSSASLKPLDWPSFFYIFPIIDTSQCNTDSLGCKSPSGFNRVSVDSCNVELGWWGNGSTRRYEVAVSKYGREPEEGVILQSDTTVVSLRVEPWDTVAQLYTAWVRCLCDSGEVSDWNGRVTFLTHCQADEPEIIDEAVDKSTRLMPNPASGSVTVASSFRIAEVELFGLDGRSLLRSKADAMSTTLNLDGLAAGTYIVRIATTAGTAYKKLVVK
ncbi:MAG: T9SS type A sorting domain-containing protein [Bacteroidales bacterium]|nr:T9SS type A sorting domain-containing protein [Bacteroidales bacterium]